MSFIKNLNKKNITFICIGVLINLFIFSNTNRYFYDNKDISCLFIQVYSNLPVKLEEWIIPIMLLIIHPVYILASFGDYIYTQVKKHGVYIFTRKLSKSKWLLSNLKRLFFNILKYYLIQFITMFILGLSYGYKISSNFIVSINLCFLFSVLSSYLLVIFSNILTLYIDEVYSYFISISILLLNMFLGFTLFNLKINSSVMKYLPFSQGILGWHSLNFINRNIHIFNFYIKDFSTCFSMIYLIFAVIIMILIGIKKVNTMDIL